jgi:hypothetical protein
MLGLSRVGSNAPAGATGSATAKVGGTRALDQRPEIALGSRFKGFQTRNRQKVVLRVQQLLKAQAQQRPVFLLKGKVPTQIEYGDLADLAALALATHQAKSEVALASDFVVGAGLTDKHAAMLPEKPEKNWNIRTIMAQQNDFSTLCF